MSELQPTPERDDYYGRTPTEWHEYLTTDLDNEPTGHLATPGSRYGKTSEECAWWSVAGLCVYFHEMAEVDSPEGLAQEVMSYVVNDRDHVMTDVLDYLHLVPQEVLNNLTVGGSA